VSLTFTSHSNLRAKTFVEQGSLSVSVFALLALILTLGAVAADQFAAPILYSSSPLWALAIMAALVWRRGETRLGREAQSRGFQLSSEAAAFRFSGVRIVLFAAGHVLLVLAAHALRGAVALAAGTISPAGWIIAALKMLVLAPTAVLIPLKRWRNLLRTYSTECVAAAVVLFTFFPGRVITAIWPWYGQILSKTVLAVSGLFVPGLTYAASFTPTIQGPYLDVTILLACSGISGLELFDCLFAFVAILDWNRLRKRRTLAAYFLGIAAMLLGNVLRLVFLVVLGNRGFADAVAQFHISAGWLFFTVVFLLYLAFVYRSLLVKPTPVAN